MSVWGSVDSVLELRSGETGGKSNEAELEVSSLGDALTSCLGLDEANRVEQRRFATGDLLSNGGATEAPTSSRFLEVEEKGRFAGRGVEKAEGVGCDCFASSWQQVFRRGSSSIINDSFTTADALGVDTDKATEIDLLGRQRPVRVRIFGTGELVTNGSIDLTGISSLILLCSFILSARAWAEAVSPLDVKVRGDPNLVKERREPEVEVDVTDFPGKNFSK